MGFSNWRIFARIFSLALVAPSAFHAVAREEVSSELSHSHPYAAAPNYQEPPCAETALPATCNPQAELRLLESIKSKAITSLDRRSANSERAAGESSESPS